MTTSGIFDPKFQVTVNDVKSAVIIDNYLHNAASEKKKISIKDPVKVEADPIELKGRMTFDVRVLSWVKTSSNFVEFQIQIRYLEGAK